MGMAQWTMETHVFFPGLPWVSNGQQLMVWGVNFQSLDVPSLNITAKAYSLLITYHENIQCSLHVGKHYHIIFMLFF